MKADFIEEYIINHRRAHLVGIAGVSMSPLAQVLKGQGLSITGSDMQESEAVTRLRDMGIPVVIGHQNEDVKKAEMVIRTAAVKDENPEIVMARQCNIPVFERAEVWGVLMRRYQNALCLAGTHGKTTTTSMCTHIAMAANIDPTVMIGGTIPLLGSGYRVGEGETIIMESCEYCNSFHSFFPTVAVILNIELDHLDFFTSLDEIKQSFLDFARKVPSHGAVIVNADDEIAMDAIYEKVDATITYGIAQGDMHTENLEWNEGNASFDLIYKGAFVTHIDLRVPGLHNVQNALASAVASMQLGIPSSAIKEGLESYFGAGRRFEYKGEVKGAKVYDDYAHHPSELRALFDSVSQMGYERVICVFQPHTYTRTKELFSDFVYELQKADVLWLTEIYAARERNIVGISSQDLANQIPNAKVVGDLDTLAQMLYDMAKPGDLILTVGAGNVFEVAETLVNLQESK